MIIKVNDAHYPKLEVYSLSSEVKIKHIYEPAPGLFIAESPNVVLRALHAGYQAESLFMEERFLSAPEGEQSGPNNIWASISEILRLAEDVPVYVADQDLISKVCGFKQSRGFLAAMKRKALPSVSEVLKGASKVAVLEEVENPTNVGAIFRSAAALGMDAVLLSDSCADPLYRRASRVSMGGIFQIPWTFTGSKNSGLSENSLCNLKEGGFLLAAMALSERSVMLNELKLRSEDKIAVLLGNEQNGLLPGTLDACDYLVQIPMQNGMDSLNVASASAVVFWQLGLAAYSEKRN